MDGAVCIRYESECFSSTDGARRAGHFTVSDLALQGRFANKITLDLDIRNLGDRRYAYDEGFPEAGRSVFADLRWAF